MKTLRDPIKLLELTFWFALITHGVGLFSMALLVMPGMPGGMIPDAERIRYIANNAALWQAGWLPWQLSALSDLLIAIAMLVTKSVPLQLRILVLLLTIISLIPDQTGQFLWVRDGSSLAKEAIAKSDLSSYLKFEEPIYMNICGWAAMLYSILAGFWTVSLQHIISASKSFYYFSWSIWILSFICSILFLLSAQITVPFIVLAIANAIFFPLLILWFACVLHYLIRLQRPFVAWGRYAKWQLPQSFPLKPLLQIAGDNLVLRRAFELIAPIPLASDISEVVYINYLVPAEKLEPLVPKGLDLQKLGDGTQKYALFSILTFNHSNFGPQRPSFIRKLLRLSGLVSNWRIHVTEPESGTKGIYFLTNATDNILMSLGARVLSEGMPMQVANVEEKVLNGTQINFSFSSGGGSAPELSAQLQIAEKQFQTLASPWAECFEDFRALLEYAVPQERAISSQDFLNRVCFQEIRLDIPLDNCKLLEGSVHSSTVQSIVGNETPICFLAPSLEFRFDREHYRDIKD